MNQGLKHLGIQAQKQGVLFKEHSKIVIIPFLGFIDQLIILMRKYISTLQHSSWAAYIVAVSSDRQFSNIYGSWLKYNTSSLESKLLSTLLLTKSPSKLNMYLKLRKLVLKTDFTTKSLDSLSLSHQDIIGIVHTAYQLPLSRKKITEGIKSLFISYRLQNAKIQSCVFIQYALSQHQQIREKQINEATLAQQKQQYGTIPQSILGYSSIQTQNIQSVNKYVQPSRSTSNNNPSEYVSNFQSVIHDQNGLYRKIKSSQVSLEGFKVIDHKFHNLSQNQTQNQSFKREIGSKFMSGNPKNIKTVNDSKNTNIRTYTQPNSRFVGPHKKMQHGSKQKQIKKSNLQQQQIRQVNSNSYIKNAIPSNQEDQRIHDSSYFSGTKQVQQNRLINDNVAYSPSYSSKFKSPDMSYQLSANSNFKSPNINRNILDKNQIIEELNKDKQKRTNTINLVKVEQQQNEQPVKNKQGGYDMWKKLNQRNQTFIAKMLGGRKRVDNVTIDDESKQLQSINVIQNSIVRHFGIQGRENRQSNSKQKKQTHPQEK